MEHLPSARVFKNWENWSKHNYGSLLSGYFSLGDMKNISRAKETIMVTQIDN